MIKRSGPRTESPAELLMQLVGHSISLHSLPPAALSQLRSISTGICQDLALPVRVLKDDVAQNKHLTNIKKHHAYFSATCTQVMYDLAVVVDFFGVRTH